MLATIILQGSLTNISDAACWLLYGLFLFQLFKFFVLDWWNNNIAWCAGTLKEEMREKGESQKQLLFKSRLHVVVNGNLFLYVVICLCFLLDLHVLSFQTYTLDHGCSKMVLSLRGNFNTILKFDWNQMLHLMEFLMESNVNL